MTIFSVRQYISSKLNIHSFLAMLLSIAAFVVPASSVNYPSALYYTAIFLVISSFLFLFYRTEPEPFSRLEIIMLVSWLVYPVVTALDLWLRVGWIWIEFQEPSRFLLVLPIFLMARRVGFSQDMLKWGVFVGALATAVWGYYQKIDLGVYRAGGGTSDYNFATFGDIALMLGVLAIALFQPQWRVQKRWLLLALFGLFFGVFASLASGTRGGWISMPFFMWVMVDLTDNPTYKKRFAVLAGFVLVAFLVWLFVPFISERVNAIPTAIYEYLINGDIVDGSAGLRLAFWHAAALIFWENPLFGSGPGTYYVEKLKLIDAELIPTRAKSYTGPHSQLFNSLYEQGVVGALMVYFIYVAFIFHCRAHLIKNKALATSGILLAVGFMDFGIAEVIWDINNAGVFFTVMMVLIAGKLSHDRSQISLNHR